MGVSYTDISKVPIPNGLGVMINENMIRKGFFTNGKLNGYGRVQHANGDIYHGFLKDNVMYGTGCYYKLSLKSWQYGFFSKNKKIIDKRGKGYPISIMSNILNN